MNQKLITPLKLLEQQIANYNRKPDIDRTVKVLQYLYYAMHEGEQVLVPIHPPESFLDLFDPEIIQVGDTVTVKEEAHMKLAHIDTDDGKSWLALFTSPEEYEKGEHLSTITVSLDDLIRNSQEMMEDGFIINPWGQYFFLTKELMKLILDVVDRQEGDESHD